MKLNAFAAAAVLLYPVFSQAGVNIVQMADDHNVANSNTESVPIAATGSGNLIVVITSCCGHYTTTNVTDGTTTFTQAVNAQSTANPGGSCNSDVWYLLSSNPGKTSITVTCSGTSTSWKEGFVYEVNGFKTVAFDVANGTSGQVTTGGLDTGAAVTTTGALDFVVAGVQVSNAITANPHAGNEFTYGGELTPQNNGYCSLVTQVAGSHQPVWDDAGGAYNASTAAFKMTMKPVNHKVIRAY